jgi:two-component sensor histidine kinase
LRIVQILARQLKGDLKIERGTEQGNGTTFRVTFQEADKRVAAAN